MDAIAFDTIAALKGEGELSLSPGRTALFVIDMQRYFVEPDYPFGQTWAKVLSDDALAYFERVSGTVIPNVHALLSRCRELGIPVYFTAFGSLRDDGRDLPGWARQHNLLSQQMVGKPMYPACSDPSWQIHDSLRPAPGEQVVAKTTSGPLNSTKLDQTLRLLGVDTIVVTGVVTNVCVTQTAREFADRGFTVVVPEDACSTLGEERHRGALETFAFVFGRVSSTSSVLNALQAEVRGTAA